MDIKEFARVVSKFSEIIRGENRWAKQKKALLKQCQKLFQAEVCAIFLVKGDTVVLDGHIGYRKASGRAISFKKLQNEMTYKVGCLTNRRYDGITGWVVSKGKEVSVDKRSHLTRFTSHQGKPDTLGIWDNRRPFRCLFAVPLKVGNDTIGVLKVENKRIPQGRGKYSNAVFDELDKECLRALANFFSIAVRLSFFRGFAYDELLTLTMSWLEQFDRRNLYQHMIEFCATLFKADVCALFVRTRRIDGKERVALAAGRMPDGEPMDPMKLFPTEVDSTYEITTSNDGPFDGVTGKIASTGESELVNNFSTMKKKDEHRGKWDTYVWGNRPDRKFLCMMGVPVRISKQEGHRRKERTIGVLKVERKKPAPGAESKRDLFTEEDLDILASIADGFAKHVNRLIGEGQELRPQGDYEIRVPRSQGATFEQKPIGEVVIGHRMTSICRSDIYYFMHDKERRKLDERLPMALGHETVGEIQRAGPNVRYRDTNKKIIPGNKVVVIPLIPCGTCHVCTGDYGENYCPSSRFMASNAPGSFRTSYLYDAKLVLKIADNIPEHLALFVEPLSNVVQMLDELGFVPFSNQGEDGTVGHDIGLIDLNMRPFDQHDFEYFHLEGDRFSNIFNTITAEEPNPRTLFVLKNPDPARQVGSRRISHTNIMVKGLGLLGHSGPEENPNSFTRWIEKPKILILGSGVSSYLLAMLLRHVYCLPADAIVVTGRTNEKLDLFSSLTSKTVNITDFRDDKRVISFLRRQGRPGERPYDVVFECVGSGAVEENIKIGLEVLGDEGIIALFGLTAKNVSIDFTAVMNNMVYIKGFSRGSLASYERSLDYIHRFQSIRDDLSQLIDTTTRIRGIAGFHDLRDVNHLTEVFHKAAEKKQHLGRLVVRNIRFYEILRDVARYRAPSDADEGG